MTAKPSTELAEPSFKRMAERAEGIYASSSSVDGELQPADHGLTLFPKIQSRGSSCIERAPTGVEERPSGHSDQLRSVKNDFEERGTSTYGVSVYETFPRVDRRPSKRRKLPQCISEKPRLSNQARVPGTQPLPLLMKNALPAPHKVAGKPEQPYGGKENFLRDAAEVPSFSKRDGLPGADLHQEDSGGDVLPGEAEPTIEKSIVGNRVFISQLPGPPKDHTDRRTPDPKIPISKDNSKNLSSVRKTGCHAASQCDHQCSESEYLADRFLEVTVLDPDVPFASIQGHEGFELDNCVENKIDCSILSTTSGTNFASAGVLNGANGPRYEPTRPTTSMPLKHAPRKFTYIQDSVNTSEMSPEPPVLTSNANHHLQQSPQLCAIRRPANRSVHQIPQALDRSKPANLSTHQIPEALRQLLDALLTKFQDDEQFQKSILAYMMEIIESDEDYDGDGQAKEENLTTSESTSRKPGMDLTGLTLEQVTAEFRKLEAKHEKLKKDCTKARERSTKFQGINNKLRLTALAVLEKPAGDTGRAEKLPVFLNAQPSRRMWDCRGMKNSIPCGTRNYEYVRALVWAKNLKCQGCNQLSGPFQYDSHMMVDCRPRIDDHGRIIPQPPRNIPQISFATESPADQASFNYPVQPETDPSSMPRGAGCQHHSKNTSQRVSPYTYTPSSPSQVTPGSKLDDEYYSSPPQQSNVDQQIGLFQRGFTGQEQCLDFGQCVGGSVQTKIAPHTGGFRRGSLAAAHSSAPNLEVAPLIPKKRGPRKTKRASRAKSTPVESTVNTMMNNVTSPKELYKANSPASIQSDIAQSSQVSRVPTRLTFPTALSTTDNVATTDSQVYTLLTLPASCAVEGTVQTTLMQSATLHPISASTAPPALDIDASRKMYPTATSTSKASNSKPQLATKKPGFQQNKPAATMAHEMPAASEIEGTRRALTIALGLKRKPWELPSVPEKTQETIFRPSNAESDTDVDSLFGEPLTSTKKTQETIVISSDDESDMDVDSLFGEALTITNENHAESAPIIDFVAPLDDNQLASIDVEMDLDAELERELERELKILEETTARQATIGDEQCEGDQITQDSKQNEWNNAVDEDVENGRLSCENGTELATPRMAAYESETSVEE